jgi:hypothetical protein
MLLDEFLHFEMFVYERLNDIYFYYMNIPGPETEDYMNFLKELPHKEK